MAVVSLRRRGRTGCEIRACGHRLHWHRPALESLEQRLPPGDMFLGGLIAGVGLAPGSAAGGDDLFRAPAAASELLSGVEVGREWVETAAIGRPEHSTLRAGSLGGESAGATDVHRQGMENSGEFVLSGLTEEAGTRLMHPRTALQIAAVFPPSAPRSAETFITTPPPGLSRTPAGFGTFAAIPFRHLDGMPGGLPGNRPDGSAGDLRGGNSIRVLHTFDDSDGSYPDTDLVRDNAGNLYGMTVKGGDFDGGTVFRIAPSSEGWVHTVLYNFTGGADGGQPYGGVTLDGQGNLYGTAVIGGSGFACEEGCGVVFKLTNSGGSWTQEVIHNFQGGDDGAGPGGPVSFDSLGNLYGMTPIGGVFGIGTVFQLAPQSNGQWIKSTIHDFTGGDDGGAASAGRLLIVNRTIFGVATVGGANGAGVAFKITPSPSGTWTYTTLYAFQGQPDGVFPYGGLVQDAAGNFYGTTYYGGTDNLGVVYKLSQVGGVWSDTVLHSFKGGTDGASSISGLIFGSDGSLYGTTSEGGAACDCGTIFKLTATGGGNWTERVLHRFTGTPAGAYPYAGLVSDPAGNMYGATVRGGADDDGIVYKFTI